jgi:hypothetical protein
MLDNFVVSIAIANASAAVAGRLNDCPRPCHGFSP